MIQNLTPEFKAAVIQALDIARTLPDDALVYMTYPEHCGIYADDKATTEQAIAGGCENCSFLGLWADSWPGYTRTPHGVIWLYEDGIRQLKGNADDSLQARHPGRYDIVVDGYGAVRDKYGPLTANILDVLTHEMAHALQRDHVLDALDADKASGAYVSGRGMVAANVRGCGVCPSSRLS